MPPPPPPPPPAVQPWDGPSVGARSPSSDDAFSVIDDQDGDKLDADQEECAKHVIQDLWEGKRNCACCTNWVADRPPVVDEDESEQEDEGAPLVVRRKRTDGGKRRYEIDSIDVRSAPLRAALVRVFDRFDSLVPSLKYLTFLAPFRPFYWRWAEFERAVAAEQDEEVAAQLRVLCRLVKKEMHRTFAVTKELLAHDVITHPLLWTVFPPGELVYTNRNGLERLYVVRSTTYSGQNVLLHLNSLDWNGHYFILTENLVDLVYFPGTRKITDLNYFPVKYLGENRVRDVKERLLARGRKFVDLAGVFHRSYREKDSDTELRIIIDAESYMDATSRAARHIVNPLVPIETMPLYSGQISQTSIDPIIPEDGHIPLDESQKKKVGRRRGSMWCAPPPPHPPPMACLDLVPPPPMGIATLPGQKTSKFDTEETVDEGVSPPQDLKVDLTDGHLLIASPQVCGFCLKEKQWRRFNLDRVSDIKWNESVFDQLVLPDGYKELILAHVEAQLHDGADFDDVINGKGGGLVILLEGEPGVGKTLTVESVAERLHAPLFKMELRFGKSKRRAVSRDRRSSNSYSDSDGDGEAECDAQGDITEDFKLASKWNAVLLIDECDTYLQRRSAVDSSRNKIVSVFLQHLEYYPSLLFMTTNRETTLDIALQSRVHLTINYPALDFPSRLLIWRNFLARTDPPAFVTADELERLARLELNGRRIKNVVKTAQVMARKMGRGLRAADAEKVLRITEGLVVVD